MDLRRGSLKGRNKMFFVYLGDFMTWRQKEEELERKLQKKRKKYRAVYRRAHKRGR
jgi:hypothetical protein